MNQSPANENSIMEIPDDYDENNPGQVEDDMNYLKHVIVSEKEMATIIEKLNLTRKFRIRLLKETETDLREMFPFFFSHPALVSYLLFI